MKPLIITLFLALTTFWANAQTQLVPQRGGHCYSIDVPTYMTRTFDLNDVASLQYQNTGKEAYVIVVEDSKAQMESLGLKFTSAKDFLENFLQGYNKDVAQRKISAIREFTALGNSLAQAEFTWTADDVNFFMITTAVESKGYFYKILTWTVAENKAQLLQDFLAISKSLKD